MMNAKTLHGPATIHAHGNHRSLPTSNSRELHGATLGSAGYEPVSTGKLNAAMIRSVSMSRQGPPVALTAQRASVAASTAQLHLLIVDDDPPIRSACAEIAGGLGFATRMADSVSAARAALALGHFDLVLLDLRLPGGGGLALLDEIRSNYPKTIVMVMTAYATLPSAVEAMRIGASDYLTKPFSLEEFSTVLERAAERRLIDEESRSLRENMRSSSGLGDLIGCSPAMEKLYRCLLYTSPSLSPASAPANSASAPTTASPTPTARAASPWRTDVYKRQLCSRVRPDVAHITQLCVRKDLRRLGLGEALLHHCAAKISHRGVTMLSLTVTEANTAALQLYERNGFTTLHRFEAMIWDKKL